MGREQHGMVTLQSVELPVFGLQVTDIGLDVQGGAGGALDEFRSGILASVLINFIFEPVV